MVLSVTKITVGSVCSGIEAASVAFSEQSYKFNWFSEIAEEPSKILQVTYPHIPNLGDMCGIPNLISSKSIDAPDFICGGTPCQAFSLAGWKRGLDDDRGNLTLKFVDIIDTNDSIRLKDGKPRTVMLWENVEGVLKDKTNPFGCFLSSLLGNSQEIKKVKWPSSGVIHGTERNIAWRVLDAKFFGLPQQRKRLYVMAGGKDFFPENILFDKFPSVVIDYKKENLQFSKNGHQIEVFRGYTDCIYSAYGTKWNGNAAAYNGSLYVVQNEKIRRLTPLECERLMGFPDDYTKIQKISPTKRYMAIGNSWAVPVIKWIGTRLETEIKSNSKSQITEVGCTSVYLDGLDSSSKFFEIPMEKNNQTELLLKNNINGSSIPEFPIIGDIQKVIDINPDSKFFMSPVGCKGILRRKEEKKLNINSRLEYFLSKMASTMSDDDIEKASRVQKRGRFSDNFEPEKLI
jgi:DNA (cytosine-5)-methyltransferase 1